MPTATRRSSWTRDPTEISLTPRRLDALKLLTRYALLSKPWFPALLGGDAYNWNERLRALFDGGYVDRPGQQRQHANALYHSRVYTITDKGLRALRQAGLPAKRPRVSKSFAHEHMAWDLMPRFELGARQVGARLITWPDILASRSMPEASKSAPKPWAIPVAYEGKTYYVEADGEPFGIERIVDGKKRYFFCSGIEADLNTEGLESASFERSSMFKKFTLYLEIEREQLYRTHFGFPNMLVPFFTTDAEHLKNMKALLYRITDGEGSRIILFGEPYPAFTTFRPPLPPSGHTLTASYERVGYEPFHFLTA